MASDSTSAALTGVSRDRPLSHWAWLSIVTALATLTLKSIAAGMTGSVGYLSDAIESLVNLAAALIALWATRLAQRPADAGYAFGYAKAEYVSSGIEATLIIFAAIAVGWTAIARFLHPQPLAQVDIGSLLIGVATLLNFVVGTALIRTGKKRQSIALEADGRHLLADVVTSVTVLVAVFVSQRLAIQMIDPLSALVVAGFVVRTGVSVVRRALAGLLDASLPEAERSEIEAVLNHGRQDGLSWHALRTRQAGARRFISLHLLVPGQWSVQRGHDYAEAVATKLRERFVGAQILVHVEPLEDPASFADD